MKMGSQPVKKVVITRGIFPEVDPQTVYDMYRGVLGYDEAARFDDLPAVGLSPDYVRRETARTVAAVDGNASVYPGIDVNIPTPEHVKQTLPEDVRASIEAAFDGGAGGLVLSRKYSEMTHANLRAAGEVIRSRS